MSDHLKQFAPLEPSWLTAQIAQMIDEGDMPEEDESLILYGLDSIKVMHFVAQLKERGVRVTFEELVRDPRLTVWMELIQKRSPS